MSRDLKGNPKYFEERKKLPIYEAYENLLNFMTENNLCILLGETGSGKTTQVIQYLYDSNLNKKSSIVCTQPRRVAAITVSKRVSEEQNVRLGTLVGYSIRFEEVCSSKTKMKFVTDGMLLKETISDPLLKKYNIILLDEAHERTLHTDILFSIIKELLKKRTDLKVIIMSATLDATKFSRFFNNCSVFYVSGRQFPVHIFYTTESQTDYVDSTVITILQIHLEEPLGDILCFLTGQEDIEAARTSLLEHQKRFPSDVFSMKIYPLYSALPTEVQMKVFVSSFDDIFGFFKAFERSENGIRKIILATNIAEVSLTVSGIRYVVDSGLVKLKTYDPKSGLEILSIEPISKAQARQRTGRAGREAQGWCYRLYLEDTFHNLENDCVPEILRCNLATAILQLLALGYKNITDFDFMDKPNIFSIKEAMSLLYKLGAFNEKTIEINELGRRMAMFPLEPQLAKVLLSASKYNCLGDVIDIVSLLSVPSIFFAPSDKQEDMFENKKKFISLDGDHFTLLNILKGYKESPNQLQWCLDNFVNPRVLKTVIKTQKQIQRLCLSMGFSIRTCDNDMTSSVIKSLLTGFFLNVASLQPDNTYMTLHGKKEVHLYPTSVLKGRPIKFVLFHEIVKTNKSYIRNVCVIDPLWALESCPNYFGK